jgi:hypothetical protein
MVIFWPWAGTLSLTELDMSGSADASGWGEKQGEIVAQRGPGRAGAPPD